MISTWKPIVMRTKASFSTWKPIIISNLASVSGLPINLPPPSKRGSTSFKRYQVRLDTSNDADENLISKSHLPNYLLSVFDSPVSTPDDEAFIPPN